MKMEQHNPHGLELSGATMATIDDTLIDSLNNASGLTASYEYQDSLSSLKPSDDEDMFSNTNGAVKGLTPVGTPYDSLTSLHEDVSGSTTNDETLINTSEDTVNVTVRCSDGASNDKLNTSATPVVKKKVHLVSR
jgi:hypothetical protein